MIELASANNIMGREVKKFNWYSLDGWKETRSDHYYIQQLFENWSWGAFLTFPLVYMLLWNIRRLHDLFGTFSDPIGKKIYWNENKLEELCKLNTVTPTIHHAFCGQDSECFLPVLKESNETWARRRRRGEHICMAWLHT